MSAYSSLHFCLIGMSAPSVTSGAHPDLAGVIDVTMNAGEASVTVSGNAADVRRLLTKMLDAAMHVVPKAQPEAQP